MTRVLLAAALLGATALPAFAGNFECDQPRIFKGKVGRNPVTSIFVHYDPNDGVWSISHTLADGKRINREDQYSVANRTDFNAPTTAAWGGSLNRNVNLYMEGQIFYADGAWQYEEDLWDTARGNIKVMQATATCHIEGESPTIAAQPNPPSYSSQAPAPSYGNSFAVPMTADNAGLHIAVKLGPMTYGMIVDTGATLGSITEVIAESLVTSGLAEWGDSGTSVLADGSEHVQRSVIVHSVELGGRIAFNVQFSVQPNNNATMLLGMSALNQFGRFTVDGQNGRLVFG
jgi:predicted aspartyl protease